MFWQENLNKSEQGYRPYWENHHRTALADTGSVVVHTQKVAYFIAKCSCKLVPCTLRVFHVAPPPNSLHLWVCQPQEVQQNTSAGGLLWCAVNSGRQEAQSWDSPSWPICIPKSHILPFCVKNNTGFLPSSRRTNFPWKYLQGKNHLNSFSLFPPFRAI